MASGAILRAVYTMAVVMLFTYGLPMVCFWVGYSCLAVWLISASAVQARSSIQAGGGANTGMISIIM
jgi:hypothetical protein